MTSLLDEPRTQEWWERLRDRRAAWWAARPDLARRWARVRAVGLWAGLLWLGVLLVLRPELRLGVRAYVGAAWIVVAWFLLARTKTLTWSGLMRFFAACVPWSVLIGVVSTGLSRLGGLDVAAAGPGVAIAAITEETLKLLPVALVAALAPRRTGRLATADWLLLGAASGAAFIAVEELLRRTAWETASGLGILGKILAVTGDDGLPAGWVRFGVAPWGASAASDGVATGSHVVLTALASTATGLGVAAWRHARTTTGTRRRLWSGGAVALPVLATWLAVCDHAMWNVVASWGEVGDTTPRYLDPATSTIPWAIRATWSATGHGHGRVALLLLAFAAALLLDARRLARLDGAALVPGPVPTGVLRATAWVPGTWPAPLAVVVRAAVDAAAWLAWVVWRDVTGAVAAHARADGESRRDAVTRGRAFVAGQRLVREEAFALLAPDDDAAVRRRRLLATGATAVLLLGGLVVAPVLAARIGWLPYEQGAWLAGQLDALARWWDGLGLGGQIAVGLGIAALIALSGGSLGLAFGLSGVLTYGMAHGRGLATFVRDPRTATRDYLATTTPAEAVLDLGEFALTFAPGNFGGAVAGRGLRHAARELADDPAAFLAARRELMRTRGDAGHIDLSAFFRREPIRLADGSLHRPLDAAADAGFAARYRDLPPSHVRARGAAGAYQERIYGLDERVIRLDDGSRVIPDGMTPRYGALGDAKHVSPTKKSSFYLPDSMGKESMSRLAVAQLDSKLIKLARAADAFTGSDGVVEIATNHPITARVFEARMRALGIRGYVRLQP